MECLCLGSLRGKASWSLVLEVSAGHPWAQAQQISSPQRLAWNGLQERH